MIQLSRQSLIHFNYIKRMNVLFRTPLTLINALFVLPTFPRVCLGTPQIHLQIAFFVRTQVQLGLRNHQISQYLQRILCRQLCKVSTFLRPFPLSFLKFMLTSIFDKAAGIPVSQAVFLFCLANFPSCFLWLCKVSLRSRRQMACINHLETWYSLRSPP